VTRLGHIAAAVGLLLGVAAAPARAEIWVVLENPNSPPERDFFEVFDRVCNTPVPAIAVRGLATASFSICGGLGNAGSINIRYAGEGSWTTISGLHGWSSFEAPRRPMSLKRKSPLMDQD
jgi:hypothetical protein